MAFPFIFEENFELGTRGDFDSESDTGSLMDFPHYSDLARIPGMEVPFRGAYCMRWTATAGDTNDHTVTDGAMDIADTATAWLRFYLFIGKDFAATSDDIFNIFEWQQAGGTVEAVISLQITASTNAVDIGIADGTEVSSGFTSISKGVWHAIEARFTVDVTPGTDGILTLLVDASQVQNVTGHNQAAAVGAGVLGPQNMLSTTTGTLLFDQFIFDDAQIFPIARRFPETLTLFKTGHVFVGPGRIDNLTLISGDTTVDNTVELWDTDTADTNDASSMKVGLAHTAASEIVDPAGMPVEITRGAYVVITGTVEDFGPRAIVQIGQASAYSAGRIKDYGIKRGGV